MTPEQIAELRAKRYNGTVVSIHKVHSDLMILRVNPDFVRPPHKPGQYCSLGLGQWEPRVEGCQEETVKEGDATKLIRRAYSLSCSILDTDGSLLDISKSNIMEFYIVLVRETGDPSHAPGLTPRLFCLQPGDRLNVGEKITGHYNLDPVQPTDNVIFLATGTGEAPHNYMIWELLRRGHSAKIMSVCCVRYRKDLAYLETHEALMQRFPNYRYVPLTTRDSHTSTKKKYIQDLIVDGDLEAALGDELDPCRTHVFLCGNPKMIGVKVKNPHGEWGYPQPTGVIELLEKRGFVADNSQQKVKGNIHFEEYW